MKKEQRFMWAMRFTKSEKEMLKYLAELDEVTMSKMVRQLVKRSYDRRK